MMDIGALAGFIAAALVVLLLPGPGVFYIVARSLGQGQRAGLVSALGLSAGALVHAVAAAAGLSAILLTSALAFEIVKLLGAAYLVYLGLRVLLGTTAPYAQTDLEARDLRRLFTDGVVVSIFNPKIPLFFLAFLPQFVDPAQGSAAQQILFLGALYALLALGTDSAYALLAARVRGYLARGFGQGPMPRYATGLTFIGLGISAALVERK